MKDEFLKKLKEKYENGEISKEIYESILERYLRERNSNGQEKKIRDEEKEEENVEKSINKIVKSAVETAKKSVDIAMKNVDEVMEKRVSEESRRDYKCAGSCVLGPGRYDYVSAAGSLKITGDVVAKRISVSGALSAEGNIKTESFKCAGAAKIQGEVNGEVISIAGALKAKNVIGEELKFAGGIAAERIKGERIRIGGYFSAQYLEGEEIHIKMSKEKSKVKEIRGENITVECERGFLRKYPCKLEAEKIEGEKIYLENVVASYVKGEEVEIGDNCIIDKLEAEKMSISKKSQVKEVIRI